MPPRTKIHAITVERFKSFGEATRVEFAPLTIVHGRNNGGKSSLIQSLLLLKQTLADPRPEVPLRLEGYVEAFSLRELTTGWPEQGARVQGPSFSVEWESSVNVDDALEEARRPDIAYLVKHSTVPWFKTLGSKSEVPIRVKLKISTEEIAGVTEISSLELSQLGEKTAPQFRLERDGQQWKCFWKKGHRADKISVDLDHFIPHLHIDRSDLGPRDRQRAWYNAFVIAFAQPLRSLEKVLFEFQYLGSMRAPPPSLYRPASSAPHEIGVSGEFAAQLLHRRQHDLVHYLPPLEVEGDATKIPDMVRARPLVDAVNDVLRTLGVQAPLKLDVVRDIGFRLLFGSASLPHVGRGLTYLLPLVELGLFADPIRFSGTAGDLHLADYSERCGAYTHVAVEEPEAHLHPKVQSRLAHWLVSLAMANRRLIVETHSDHLVRRLRGLVARAGSGSELERWLLANVLIHGVEQDDHGRSTVTTTRLTPEGGMGDVWPADFMDEASSEESTIYYAGLDKTEPPPPSPGGLIFMEGDEPEGESEP
jgi:predicted ATPase